MLDDIVYPTESIESFVPQQVGGAITGIILESPSVSYQITEIVSGGGDGPRETVKIVVV